MNNAGVDIEVRKDLVYTEDEATGVPLKGDLYLPPGTGPCPLLVAVHGGAWKLGTKGFYVHLGPFLAARGIAAFCVDYTLTTRSSPSYPRAPRDIVGALAHIGSKAAEWGIDLGRVGIMGDSAGAHLAALISLNGKAYGNSAKFPQPKVCVGIYGVYDMAAQWAHDQIHRPADNITQNFLGKALYEDRRAFFESSPLSHAINNGPRPSFLLAWGTEDDIVDPQEQSEAFLVALKQAGFFVRTHIQPGAPHFWSSDALEGRTGYAAAFAAYLDDFLKQHL